MGGKLYPEGMSESSSWSSSALVYYSEEVARVIASPFPHDGLVSAVEDVLRIVRASGLPAVRVWIREDLESVARLIWEGQGRHT